MNLYATTAEIKAFLDISGSAKDALIAMLNKQATATLNEMLSVNDLALHKVDDEVHDAAGCLLELKDLHAVAIEEITDDDVAYTQTDPYDLDNYMVHLTDPLSGGTRKAKVTYAAGWNASGMAKITVSDVAGLGAAATITLGNLSGATNGSTLTRGVQWTAQATEAAEAIAIAAALTTAGYVRAFAIGAVVYVIENGGATVSDTPQLTGRAISVSDATRLALSAATLAGVDFPESLRGMVMLMVGGSIAARKSKGMKSHDEFKAKLAAYKRVKVAATKSRTQYP